MKIRFGTKEFEVYGIQYQVDENNIPVDICICAEQKTLEEIRNYCSIGCNIQEVNPNYNGWPRNFHYCYEGLFARLDEFEVVGARAYLY